MHARTYASGAYALARQLKLFCLRYILTTTFPVYGFCFQLINFDSLIKCDCTALIAWLLLLLLMWVHSHETEKKSKEIPILWSLRRKCIVQHYWLRLLSGASASHSAEACEYHSRWFSFSFLVMKNIYWRVYAQCTRTSTFEHTAQ